MSSHRQCSQLFIILFFLLIKQFFVMMTEDKWKWWHLSHNFAMFKVDIIIFWNFQQVYKINFFKNSGNLRELPTLSSPPPSPSGTFRACVLPTGTSYWDFLLGLPTGTSYWDFLLGLPTGTSYWWLPTGGSVSKEPPPNPDPWVRKIPLKKKMAIHSSILAWRISWTQEPGGLQPTGSQESDTA